MQDGLVSGFATTDQTKPVALEHHVLGGLKRNGKFK
jgi:hypothetical protein